MFWFSDPLGKREALILVRFMEIVQMSSVLGGFQFKRYLLMSMLHLSRWNKNTSEFNWSNSLKPTYWNL